MFLAHAPGEWFLSRWLGAISECGKQFSCLLCSFHVVGKLFQAASRVVTSGLFCVVVRMLLHAAWVFRVVVRLFLVSGWFVFGSFSGFLTWLCSIRWQHPTDQTQSLVSKHAVSQIQTDQRWVGRKGRVQGHQACIQQWVSMETGGEWDRVLQVNKLPPWSLLEDREATWPVRIGLVSTSYQRVFRSSTWKQNPAVCWSTHNRVCRDRLVFRASARCRVRLMLETTPRLRLSWASERDSATLRQTRPKSRSESWQPRTDSSRTLSSFILSQMSWTSAADSSSPVIWMEAGSILDRTGSTEIPAGTGTVTEWELLAVGWFDN